MTKPWERDLTPETGIGEDNKNDTWLFQDVDEAVAIVLAEAGPEWAALFKAAPNMARALRDALSVLHRAEDVLEMGQVRGLRDACETVEAALRKAGVIP